MSSDTPESLYNLCINVATSHKFCKREYRFLPDRVLFDFYYKMFLDKRLCPLTLEIGDFIIFVRMLKLKHKRTQLLRCFQALIDHSPNIIDDIVDCYENQYCINNSVLSAVDLGFRIGSFFTEGAWYKQAHRIYNILETLCLKRNNDIHMLRDLLDCYHKRIFVESSFCMFQEAENTFNLANKTADILKEMNSLPNLAGLYANFSKLYVMKSQYDEAYKWSKKAMQLISDDLPSRLVVDILRQASKSCVYKRRFAQAGLLIQQALLIACQLYEIDEHPHYASTLNDYGFYLLNYDNVEESVKVYKGALNITKNIFGKNNINVGIAYEDLSYALYVKEYSSGQFYYARECAEKAIKINEKLYPKNHHALASIKRVKALILEEIAIDMRDPMDSVLQEQYLQKSEQLHKSALELSLATFGERNVQTAKHYGNLGRLYQSMQMYAKAEQMHLQAIAIKTDLLGAEDYEVGLSIGHLASLYNYHMKRYPDAEQLYLQSINISLKLFGVSYSGLEYDYRGLINVYTHLKNTAELTYFTNAMRDWENRRTSLNKQPKPVESLSLNVIVEQFLNLC